MYLCETGLSEATVEESEEEETENGVIYSRTYCLCLCVSAGGKPSVCAAKSSSLKVGPQISLFIFLISNTLMK